MTILLLAFPSKIPASFSRYFLALLDGIKLDSIKGILIDIDDTMYSYEPNHLNGLSACYKEISKNDNVSLDFDKFKDI